MEKDPSTPREGRQLSDLVLKIVEHEVGRGEERRPEDWAQLRVLAQSLPRASELESAVEGMIRQCNQELARRAGGPGVDPARMRESVVELIRVSLRKGLGLSDVFKPSAESFRPASPSPETAVESPSTREQNQMLSNLLLGILEREIGRGEPRRPDDWARLHALAAGHPSASELVSTLERVIRECNQEMTSRFGSTEAGALQFRQSVVTLIRSSLLKKLGLSGGSRVKES